MYNVKSKHVKQTEFENILFEKNGGLLIVPGLMLTTPF